MLVTYIICHFFDRNFEPGNYLVVKDEQNTKALIIEGFTFDVFDLNEVQIIETEPEPYGRRMWVGIGWENDNWSMDVATNDTGAWFADFHPPGNYWWVDAQIFDADGDASELRLSSSQHRRWICSARSRIGSRLPGGLMAICPI